MRIKRNLEELGSDLGAWKSLSMIESNLFSESWAMFSCFLYINFSFLEAKILGMVQALCLSLEAPKPLFLNNGMKTEWRAVTKHGLTAALQVCLIK